VDKRVYAKITLQPCGIGILRSLVYRK